MFYYFKITLDDIWAIIDLIESELKKDLDRHKREHLNILLKDLKEYTL